MSGERNDGVLCVTGVRVLVSSSKSITTIFFGDCCVPFRLMFCDEEEGEEFEAGVKEEVEIVLEI